MQKHAENGEVCWKPYYQLRQFEYKRNPGEIWPLSFSRFVKKHHRLLIRVEITKSMVIVEILAKIACLRQALQESSVLSLGWVKIDVIVYYTGHFSSQFVTHTCTCICILLLSL